MQELFRHISNFWLFDYIVLGGVKLTFFWELHYLITYISETWHNDNQLLPSNTDWKCDVTFSAIICLRIISSFVH